MASAEAQARVGDSRFMETATGVAQLGPTPLVLSAWSFRVRGLASDRPEEAVGLLTQAAAQFVALGMPFEAARARLEACEALPEAGDIPEMLVRSHRVFGDLGARRYADRAARLLRSLGAAVPVARRPATGQLTPRQTEVARLVAEGLSNAEIAERLYISLRTVTTHLEHIYQQLGFNSRTALTRYVMEHGLLHQELTANT